jgi:hypothetical protein
MEGLQVGLRWREAEGRPTTKTYERVFVPFCDVGTCFVSFWMCYQSVSLDTIRESCFTDPTSNDRRMFQIWSSKVEPV